MRRSVMLLAAAGFCVGGMVNAAPPPPPSDAITRLAGAVVPTPTAATFDAYARQFAGDLAIWVDGRKLAVGKEAWLAEQRAKIGKVDRRIVGYAEGWDVLLVVDEVDDRSNVPAGMVADPRFVTRSLRYEADSEGRVHVLRIEQANGLFRQPAP